MVAGLGCVLLRFLVALFAAGVANRRLPGETIYDSARLRPRSVLPPSPGKRLGRSGDRSADADALRLLAPHACHSSRYFRSSRPTGNWRCRYPHGSRISVSHVLETV